MTFIALSILGLISSQTLPISLLPDIEIPEVTVQVKGDGYSARELENVVVSKLREQLKQCSYVEDINSNTRNGSSLIQIRFKYGINTDLAAIDVNDKIDKAMLWFPKEINRPNVIKAKISDLPVLYINVNYKETNESNDFLALSKFVEKVLRSQIEQLPEVALVDFTGTINSEIAIEPNWDKLKALGLSNNDLLKAFNENNVQLGNIRIKDGIYEYSIRFSKQLSNIDDIKNIYLNIDDNIIQFKDIADIYLKKQENNGAFLVKDKMGISLAIIKQSSANLYTLKNKLKDEIARLETENPDLNFSFSQDQSLLLDLSISNLKSSLIVGIILAIMIVFLFMSDMRLSVLIGVSLPLSVIITLLFFKVFNVSVNIISLSGLILSVGMMIDYSIVVIDDIVQYRERGDNLEISCIHGTNAVITPLISSFLTTTAIFVPLIFLSGIAGIIFYQEALIISIGLFISFVVSITIIPVLYFLFFRRNKSNLKRLKIQLLISSANNYLTATYNRIMNLTIKHYKPILIIGFFLLFGTIPLYNLVKKEIFPNYQKKEMVLEICWNESINQETSSERIKKLIVFLDPLVDQSTTWIGGQDYILDLNKNMSAANAKIYIDTKNSSNLLKCKEQIEKYFGESYKNAEITFKSSENIFENTFKNNEPAFILKIHQDSYNPDYGEYQKCIQTLKDYTDYKVESTTSFEKYISLQVDHEKMLIYGVSVSELYSKLTILFNKKIIGSINNSEDLVPVVLCTNESETLKQIREANIVNEAGNQIPLINLIHIKNISDLENILGDIDNEYIPINFNIDSIDKVEFKKKIKQALEIIENDGSKINYSFGGRLEKSSKNIQELLYTFLISILLLYFILAAQFESLIQPLIVLIEIPINLTFIFLMLYLTNSPINIMTGIGIIVMIGVVINDSILKIDTINKLIRNENLKIIDAIHLGGERRLRPIIMSAMTTSLALIPVFWGSDLGSELQKPLAFATIMGLTIGTLVSLFFVPMIYWLVYRKKNS